MILEMETDGFSAADGMWITTTQQTSQEDVKNTTADVAVVAVIKPACRRRHVTVTMVDIVSAWDSIYCCILPTTVSPRYTG